MGIIIWIDHFKWQKRFSKKLIFFSCFFLFLCSISFAQDTKIISGLITDETSIPLPGVTVIIEGTNIGVVTDFDGNYNISVPVDAKRLKFSYLGMKTQIVDIDNRNSISLVMLADLESLNEVVVVGYGTQQKRELTSAVVEVKGEVLERAGTPSNLAEALTGQLPGLTTQQISGEPGTNNVNILIRGQSTWNGSGPLILVDGIERPLNDVDVSEIASVTVLKDAANCVRVTL